jgi:uroporphyrinogen decarboxylase
VTSHERVALALSFQEPDRVPRYIGFSDGFSQNWKSQKGEDTWQEFLDRLSSDFAIVSANEKPWPSRVKVIRENSNELVIRDGWGSVTLSKTNAEFEHILEPGVRERVDPDTLVFEDPHADHRYCGAEMRVQELWDSKYVVCKTGGPYIRGSFMRGREAFLLDMVEDPGWTKAFVERLSDHLTAVGVESIRRFQLQDTGIIMHDDVCAMRGPIMGPDTYEKLFYPSLCKMIKAYKEAGASYYMQHCDGDVRPLLDMWVEAGVQVINPCEPRAGFDPVQIKRKYGKKLAMIGGIDSTRVLPRGKPEEVEDHVHWLLEGAKGGGLVICAGIWEDVSVDTMELFLRLLEEKERYPISL